MVTGLCDGAAMPKRSPPSNERPTADTTVANLARMAILDTLTGPQLVVYLRLLAETKVQRSRTVSVINADLYRSPRTAVRALRELEDLGIVKLQFDGSLQRTIEVPR